MQDVHQFGLGSLIDIDHFKFISKVTGGSVTTLPSLIISDGTAVRMILQDYSVLPYLTSRLLIMRMRTLSSRSDYRCNLQGKRLSTGSHSFQAANTESANSFISSIRAFRFIHYKHDRNRARLRAIDVKY